MKRAIEHPEDHVFGDFHSAHPPLVEQLKRLEDISQTDLNVLLFGESGTGKELLARAVHQNSPAVTVPLSPSIVRAFQTSY